jgi:small-conductance mechanosensitive channel
MGYVKTGSYFKFLKVRGDFLGKTIAGFRENHIDFAFPSRSIYIEKGEIPENPDEVVV